MNPPIVPAVLFGWVVLVLILFRVLGPRRLSIAVVVAGLLSIPICVFEAALGPKWYLNGLVYGIAAHEQVAQRLGGWRPEGFLNHGLELATWMALATVLAFWLWLCRA